MVLSLFLFYISLLAARDINHGEYRHGGTCDCSWFERLDYTYDKYQAEHDMALIQYCVQFLWGCVKTVLPPRVFKALWDYTRTFSHTDYYISCPDLYL